QLVLTKKLEGLRAKLQALADTASAFASRRAALATREAEITASLGELTETSTEEERQAVDDASTQYDADVAVLDGEEQSTGTQRADLERQISEMEAELASLNERSAIPPQDTNPTPAQTVPDIRKDDAHMRNTRTRFFGMTVQERDAFLGREDVRSFLGGVVRMRSEGRAITGTNLTIPDIMLGVIRENIEDYSKLLKYINLVPVDGTARENIIGSIPEAVWMEMLAGNYNELAFALNQIEVDGFAVGGFIPLPNSIITDSRYPALAQEVMRMLGASIGLALDRAIIYGTGIKMPLGIVPRLAQISKPSNYPTNAPEWTDLHTSNVLTVRGGTAGAYTELSGAELFKGLANACSAAKGKFSRGAKFWAMSEATYTKLVVSAISINAAGAIVTGMQKTMPIVGGDIVVLEFIPDGEMIGGYGDLYLLAQREGMSLKQSEHVHFLQRQTVFAGEARYDGLPVIANAFVAIAFDAGDVTTSSTFAADTANDDGAELRALTLGTETLVPSFSSAVTEYTLSVANATASLKFSSIAKNADKGATVAQKKGDTSVNQGSNASLTVGENTLTATVIYGTTAKTYTVKVTRAAA
ncbi:MAG: phage major capsid protein, partial [Clostridia bacterium]